jgi:Ca-activated chloride channel homolog
MHRVLLFSLLFIFTAVSAQTIDYSESAPYKPREFKPEKLKKKSKSEPEKISVDNGIINVPVSVFDRNGKFVEGLKQTDFTIFADEKEQEIASFQSAGSEPLNLILLIDTSPSTEYKIEEIQDYALSIVKQLRPQDKVLVIEFNGNMKVLSELTEDRKTISKAIRKARFGDGTSLYDSLVKVLQKYTSAIEGRKALVLLTDGVDTTSMKNGYEASLSEAEKYDVPVFPIYFDTLEQNLNPKIRGSASTIMLPGIIFPKQNPNLLKADYELGKLFLNDLVSLSGGRAIMFEEREETERKFPVNIAEEMQFKYYIGFKPNAAQTGRSTPIKVRVNRPNLLVLARGSYVIVDN